MTGRNIHVVPHGSGWNVSREGEPRPSSHHETQEEAIEVATDAAQREHVELIVHGRDGQIRMRNSYGHDPAATRG
ncbi:uncharacterized protein DUF2188 [Cupriavidus gilardii J11]|uniref:Uncharacterized protein DUF2188 n=1 Tax=Cupriavidus gilardii J11 TaxID=936133 RepID=A0A562B5A4_9BURK|nr:DUF2188 domain-containing protein [Cupriavidus gilardii]TWG80391.1 uncharacterized protein DUF2188 [Cupriavidus gilardii J11]